MRTPAPLAPELLARISQVLQDPHAPLALYRRAVGLSLRVHQNMQARHIAQHVGLSVSQVRKMHAQAVKLGAAFLDPAPRGGRRRQNMTLEEERAFLDPFLREAASGGILEIGPVHRALIERLGREVAESTAYRMLHRHGWRKVAPRPRHPKAPSDEAREAWKKNCPSASPPMRAKRKSAAAGRA